MPHARKYLALVLVAGALLFLDLWSKDWADRTLASPQHPLPVLVEAGEAGTTLGAVLAARYPALAAEVDRIARDAVSKATLGLALDPRANVFASLPTPAGPRVPVAWVVFHDGPERAPRRLDLVEKPLLRRWLTFVFDGRSRNEIETLVEQAFADATLARYVGERVPGVSEEDVPALVAEGRVLPVFSHDMSYTAGDHVVAGELYLLEERRVDVIPGFFRFDYKENPGAAWGLLASGGERFRQFFLSGVSMIAIVVILVLFVRLPTTHWSAILAFSAILSGALGNLVDRLRANFVIDFFDMYVSYMHWPTYNVADIGITLGVIALVIEMLFVKSSPFVRERREAGTEAV